MLSYLFVMISYNHFCILIQNILFIKTIIKEKKIIQKRFDINIFLNFSNVLHKDILIECLSKENVVQSYKMVNMKTTSVQ